MQGVRIAAAAPAVVRLRWRDRAAGAGFGLLALVLSFALFHDAWAHPATSLIGVSEDPMLNVWLLGLTPHAVSHLVAPWTTSLIDAPSGVNMLWTPLMPLAGILLWPVTSTAGPVVAYNLLATLTPVLSTIAAYIALRYFVHDRFASGVGALVYGFSPYAVAQLLGHPHAALGITPPLLLVLLNEMFVRRHGSARRNGLLLALLVIVQFFLSVEVLTSEALLTVLGLAILAARFPDRVRSALPSLLRACAWALPPVVLLCAWPLAVQLFGPGHVSGSIWPPAEFSADALNLVVPSALLQFAPASVQQVPFHIDVTSQVWSSYIGIPLLAVVAVAVARFRRRFDVVLFGTLFAAGAVLSLGPSLLLAGHDTGIPLPMRLVQPLPEMGNLDADRFTLYTALFGALLVAFLVADLRMRQRREWLAPLLLAVACVSAVPTVRFPTEPAPAPAFFSDGGTAIPAGSTALVLPLADAAHATPMLWQAVSGYRFSMTGGYAIRGKPGGGATTSPPADGVASVILGVEATSRVPTVTTDARNRWLAELHGEGVRTIVVGPDPASTALVELVTRVTGAAPQWSGGVALWRLP